MGAGLPAIPTKVRVSNKDFDVIKIEPSRNSDPNSVTENLFRIAESHFLRLARTSGANSRIKHVRFVQNKALEAAFEQKKKEFKGRNIPSHEVLAFHGTSTGNIESILKSNLDPHRAHVHGQAHGPGCYFSEFPDVSLGYGNGLIMFRTLPGNEYVGSSACPNKFNSKKVASGTRANTQGYGNMLIIKDPAQFMPYFVYHLEKNSN